MYTIYADDVCIHNDQMDVEELRVLSPSLSMSDCAAGSLSFTILPSNPGYEAIELFATTITVYKNNEWFWAGRAISTSVDFYNQKSIECEGVLAFLNDTHQPSWVFGGRAPLYTLIDHLLDIHNNKVGANRKIYSGSITVNDGYKERYTEYETTMEAFEDIIEDNGGHLMIRYGSDGKYYLDYLADWLNTNQQEIRFGKNLLDFTNNTTRDNFGTVIYPLGAEDENGDKLTIASVNSGSPYLKNTEAVSKWGWIEKKYEDSEITSASTLKTVAQTILNEMVSEDFSLEISAVDLHLLDHTIEDIRLYDQIRVISPYHDLDGYFPVSSVDLDLAEPQNDTFTLGSDGSTSLSSRTSSLGSPGSVDKGGELTDLGKAILESAKYNATSILNSATNGYVTTVYNDNGTSELIISDNINYKNATKLWRWNINGLGYSKDGGKTYGLAITMDGAIVADYITAGHMSADRIRAGTLYAQRGNSYFDLDNSLIHLGTASSYWVELNYNGKMSAGVGSNTYGWIDGSANVHNISTDLYSKGLNIVAPYHNTDGGPSIIRFVSENMAVLSSTDQSKISTTCGSGTISYVTSIQDNGDGSITWNTGTLKFINGLLVSNIS